MNDLDGGGLMVEKGMEGKSGASFSRSRAEGPSELSWSVTSRTERNEWAQSLTGKQSTSLRGRPFRPQDDGRVPRLHGFEQETGLDKTGSA